jgi:hypothetical protein
MPLTTHFCSQILRDIFQFSAKDVLSESEYVRLMTKRVRAALPMPALELICSRSLFKSTGRQSSPLCLTGFGFSHSASTLFGPSARLLGNFKRK